MSHGNGKETMTADSEHAADNHRRYDSEPSTLAIMGAARSGVLSA